MSIFDIFCLKKTKTLEYQTFLFLKYKHEYYTAHIAGRKMVKTIDNFDKTYYIFIQQLFKQARSKNKRKFIQKLQQTIKIKYNQKLKKMWNQCETYFLSQYPQIESMPTFYSTMQIIPIVHDLSGYEFKYFQLQNSPESIPLSQISPKNQTVPLSAVPEGGFIEEEEGNQPDSKDKDRNIVSNSLKVFRKYASDSARMENSIARQIIDKNGLNYSPEEFIRDLDKKIPRERNYFGIKFLKNILNNKEKKSNFITVIRSLLNFYYRKQVYTTVLTSWKILNPAKKKQVQGTRKIRELLG